MRIHKMLGRVRAIVRRTLARLITEYGILVGRRAFADGVVTLMAESEAGRDLHRYFGASRVEVLASRPRGKLSRTCIFFGWGRSGVPGAHYEPSLDYPELAVRAVQVPIEIRGNGLVIAENRVALPPSFMHPDSKANSRALDRLGPGIARVRGNGLPTWTVEGPLYDLGCAVPGHFGHVITEMIGRAWGWGAAAERFPDLRAVFKTPSADYEPSFEIDLAVAAGIPRDRLVWYHGNIRTDCLVYAAQAWNNGGVRWVHPVLTDTWRLMRSAFGTGEGAGGGRIFVTRELSGNRPCLNGSEVEDRFVAAGFRVVRPETMPLAEQAAIFANASVVAGFAGSGMFNMLFSGRLERVIVVSGDAYTARNEHLYALLLADRVDYLYGRSSVRPSEGRFNPDAFHSPWSVDFAKDGRSLDRILGSL